MGSVVDHCQNTANLSIMKNELPSHLWPSRKIHPRILEVCKVHRSACSLELGMKCVTESSKLLIMQETKSLHACPPRTSRSYIRFRPSWALKMSTWGLHVPKYQEQASCPIKHRHRTGRKAWNGDRRFFRCLQKKRWSKVFQWDRWSQANRRLLSNLQDKICGAKGYAIDLEISARLSLENDFLGSEETTASMPEKKPCSIIVTF